MYETASRMKIVTTEIIQYIIDSILDDNIILYGAKNISEFKYKFDIKEVMKDRSKTNGNENFYKE